MLIHKSSMHPYVHKLAAFHKYIHRLVSTPLSSDYFQYELKFIKLAVDNGYSANLILID